ncbi:heme-binding protein [Mycolicibacterium doricum]|nr:heme-binding protein [Mycolicibacterium doricum]
MNRSLQLWPRRRVVGAATAVAAAGFVGLAAAGTGVAQPPPPDPCSPAAVMRVHAGVMTQMADYLDSRPDVQQVFIDARSKATSQERHAAIQSFTDTHPDVAAAFQNIRRPMHDLMTRCNLPMGSGMMDRGMAPGQMAPGATAPGQ